MRVTLLLDTPSPHMEDFLVEVVQHRDLELQVLYCAKHNPRREWRLKPSGYTHTVLPGFNLRIAGKNLFVNPTIGALLIRDHADLFVLSVSYHTPTGQFAARLLNALGRTYVYMNEVPWLWKNSRVTQWFQRKLAGMVIGNARAILSMGHVERWKALAELHQPIINCPYYRWLDDFLELNKKGMSREAAVTHFLFCGTLDSHRKGLGILIKALQRVPQGEYQLTILGDGRYRGSYEHMARTHLGDNVRFLGHVKYEKVPCYF